jgi:hypothetical protein
VVVGRALHVGPSVLGGFVEDGGDCRIVVTTVDEAA